jgi:hypothetical protein
LLLALFTRQLLGLAALVEQRLVERQHLVQILYLVHLHLLAAAQPETKLVRGYQVVPAVGAGEMVRFLELVVRVLLDREIQADQMLLLAHSRRAAAVVHLRLAQQALGLHQVLVALELHHP